MNVETYNEYFNMVVESLQEKSILTNDPNGMVEFRHKAMICKAYVGQEEAKRKNQIDEEFCRLKNKGGAVTYLIKEAERNMNKGYTVSRRELSRLKDDLQGLDYALASRINTLAKEGA